MNVFDRPTSVATLKGEADRATTLDSRIICYACIVLLAIYGLIAASLLAHGYTMFGYRDVPKYDFSVFWAAGHLAAAGKAAAAYNWTVVHDLLEKSLPGGRSTEFIGTFYYPPWFFIALAPLGSLPFATAAAIWLAVMLVAYVATIRAILPGGTALIAAVAAPTAFLNLMSGQDGLLSAALFGGALTVLDVAPIAAGVLIGLIAYKPHFGLLLPVFLALTSRWQVFTSAAATVICLIGVTAGLFGAATFVAFVRALPSASDAYLQHRHFSGANLYDLASVYGLLRTVGLGNAAAWCGHIAAAAAAGVTAMWVTLSNARRDLKAAGVATACIIVTPYSELNDLAILTTAMAFLVRDGLSRGFGRSEWAPVAIAFLMPLLSIIVPPTGWFGQNRLVWLIGPLMCALLTFAIGRRVLADPGARTCRRASSQGEDGRVEVSG